MTMQTVPAGMSSTVTKPGSGKSIVVLIGSMSVHEMRTPKLPVKPSGASGAMIFATFRLPNSGAGVGVGFGVGVGVGTASVQFSEFDLLEEIAVRSSSLTAKTTRTPPEDVV